MVYNITNIAIINAIQFVPTATMEHRVVLLLAMHVTTHVTGAQEQILTVFSVLAHPISLN
jgi:hypothetical protein